MIFLCIPIVILAGLLVWRELAHERQVQSLLDRIQAPEQVIAQRAPEPTGDMLFVPESDEAWAEFEISRKAGEVA